MPADVFGNITYNFSSHEITRHNDVGINDGITPPAHAAEGQDQHTRYIECIACIKCIQLIHKGTTFNPLTLTVYLCAILALGAASCSNL